MKPNKIELSVGKKEIVLKEGKSFRRVKKHLAELKPIFEEIDKIGCRGNKVDANEFVLLEKLFARLKNDFTPENMTLLVEEFEKSGKDIAEFLNAQPEEAVKKATPAEESSEKKAEAVLLEEAGGKEAEVKTSESDLRTSKRAFNNAIQNLTHKYKKEDLASEFTATAEIKKGNTLYKIAEDALKQEGIKKPTYVQINRRIAEIALLNNLNDVNNVRIGTELKVGKGSQTPAQPPVVSPKSKQGQTPAASPDGGQEKLPAFGRETDTVSVEIPTGGVEVKADPKPEAEGFAESANASALQGVDLNGGTLKTYTKGTGDKTETKYVYEKDGVRFEASTPDELKTKIKTFNDAVVELSKTVANETVEAKQTRIQSALDAIMALGTESALKFAQAKLMEQKANVSKDYYAQKTIAMLKSFNPALIEQMLGADGAKFAELLNNNPDIQKAVGEVIKYLNDKFNNDEYLTLDEQAVRTVLSHVVGKDGVHVAAKTAVAEEKDQAGNVTKAAEPEVFEKTMITDLEGNSYYAAVSAKIGNDSVDIRVTDAKALDAFLAELKTATDDAKLTALFKKYAETCTDTELLKSIVQQADKLKASAADVIALVNKSNLDVIYALDIAPFAENDKTNVEAAIKARIEAIMANPELAKLPENAKYLEKIKGVELPAESTPMMNLTDITDYEESEEKVTVKDASGNDVEVTVYKYTKEGQPDVYRVKVILDNEGWESSIEASSEKDVLKLKSDWESFIHILERPEAGKTLTAEQKHSNLEKLVKIAELRLSGSMFERVALALKDDSIIDKNDPEAKALLQKLLLTRDAEIVGNLVRHDDGYIDNTLFKNDPVAFKTHAAMFKEIRDKEKAGVRLTQEEIALKNVLKQGVDKVGTRIGGRNSLYFDSEGNLFILGRSFYAASNYSSANFGKLNVIDDPILSKDKQFLETVISYDFEDKSKEEQIKVINLESVDAEILSYSDIDLSNTDQSVKDAYIAKVKKLFTYDTPQQGQKLDPSNARYVETILNQINRLTYPDDTKKKADIAAILSSFFETTGEGSDQTTKIKDFRRFTYEEMNGLADAVECYGTELQAKALAEMITPEEMEDGQFVRAIERGSGIVFAGDPSDIDDAVREKFSEFVNGMTTKEEVLALIDKIAYPERHIPFDTIMAIEGVGDSPEVITALLKNISYSVSVISKDNRIKLAKTAMQIDNSGNITFDKTKLPEGVSVQNVINALPRDCAKDDAAKILKAIFMTLDLSNEDIILLLNNHDIVFDEEMTAKIKSFIDTDAIKNGSHVGNELIDYLSWQSCAAKLDASDYEALYNNATDVKKENLIRWLRVSDSHVIVKQGDSIEKIVKNYLKKHLDKFPKLKKSVDDDADKWTDERIEEALNYYMNDFRDDILKDLGISDPTKLQIGQFIELDKIQWDDHQPNGLNYNLYY